MNYLDRFDNYKKKHCMELSVKDKLRTGYSNKNQLQQGLNIFRKNNKVSVDNTKLINILYPDSSDKIRMGQKISSGGEQLLAVNDDGIADNSLTGSYNFLHDSGDDGGSERSTESFQQREQAFFENQIEEQQQNWDDIFYEEQEQQLMEEERNNEERVGGRRIPSGFVPNPPSRRGGARERAGRPTREQRLEAERYGMEARDIRAVEDVVTNLMLEAEITDDED
jgi:hypothetical protein